MVPRGARRWRGMRLAVPRNAAASRRPAVEIERAILVQKTRLLGAEHEETLNSAINLALSLWRCGQKMESEQLRREMLALSRRALGPAHECTQIFLLNMRKLGLAAR